MHRVRAKTATVSGGGGGGAVPGVAIGPNYGAPPPAITLTNALGSIGAGPINNTIGLANALASVGVGAINNNISFALAGSVLGNPNWRSEAHSSNRGVVAQDATLTMTITKPTDTVNGDLLLLFFDSYLSLSAQALIGVSGWTTIAGDSITTGLDILRSSSFYKFASSEPASYDFSIKNFGLSQTIAIAGEIHRMNGTASSSPIDSSATATLAATALDPDPSAPAVTTVTGNNLVFAHLWHDHAGLSNTHTPPASHDERTDFQTTGSNESSTTATRIFATAGLQAAAEFNCTEAVSTDAVMQRIAIKPGAFNF